MQVTWHGIQKEGSRKDTCLHSNIRGEVFPDSRQTKSEIMDAILASRDRDLHFITCDCYGRRALLGSARRRDVLVQVLERMRRCYQFMVAGYVVMPDHFHLLIGDTPHKPLSVAVESLKIAYASRVMAQTGRRCDPDQGSLFDYAPESVWEEQFRDLRVATEGERVERLRHLHRNPVEQGLVTSPELWRWSSFRAYALGEDGPVTVNTEAVLGEQPLRRTPGHVRYLMPDGMRRARKRG